MTQVFFVAGTGKSSISFRMDLNRGLNKEKPSAKSAIFLHFHLLLKACYQLFWKCKKPVITDWLFSCREEYRIIEPDLGGVGGD